MLIDTDRLADLRADLEEDIDEVVALFLSEADAAIREVQGTTDPAAKGELFHALKGSALNLGLAELAALGRAGEADPDNVDAARVRAVFDASRAELLAALGAPG